MAVSLKQIAAQTNVSIATVSKALSGQEDISGETRERVLKVAREMNYRPNLLVRGMQTGRTNSIGLMVPVGVSFYSEMVAGVHDQLQANNYVPILLWASRNLDKTWEGRTELELIHQLVDRRVDGLIICPIEDEASDDYLHEIYDHRLPLVAVDRRLPNSHKASFVGTDDFYGGQLAAEHLLEQGHRHIVHLAGPDFTSTACGRRKGFESVISQCADVRYEVCVDRSFAGDVQVASQYFNQHSLPTAIFAANDHIASSVYAVMAQRHLRVGVDIAVVGFADLPFAQFMSPSLTSIRQNPKEIGSKAARLLLARIDSKASDPDEEYSPVEIRLKPQLIVRDSTALFHA